VRSARDIVPAIAFADWRGTGPLPEGLPEGFEVVPQPVGNIGAGLAAAAEHFLARGMCVVLVDSDSPTLPLAHLEEAVERLRNGDADCVVGPADDGGYCMLGLSRSCPSLFVDVPWSTERVVPVTLERAAAAGLDGEFVNLAIRLERRHKVDPSVNLRILDLAEDGYVAIPPRWIFPEKVADGLG